MFMFGFLKFFEPFRTMFDVQIAKSDLPPISVPFGKVAEMAIGLGLLLPACFRHKIVDLYGPVVFAASAGLVVNMAVATYVHLQPDVPASVLPPRDQASVHPVVRHGLGGTEPVPALRREEEQIMDGNTPGQVSHRGDDCTRQDTPGPSRRPEPRT